MVNPVPQKLNSVPVPVPMRGINAVDSISSMGAEYCLFSYNLLPGQYGLRVRNGYREHVTNITGTGGVKTLIPVQALSSSNARVFAVSSAGIWNVTSSTASPSTSVAFGTTTGNAGWASWSNFVTSAGQFIAVCDGANGYYFHTVSGNTWTQVTLGGGANQITPADPASFDFVMEFKGRLFFVLRNTATSYYLPSGQLTGTVSAFEWGDKFPHGGSLVGLYNYSTDGGAGPNSYIVAVSSAGDILMYSGTNPASDFAQVGKWYVGALPSGRRGVYQDGNDLLILTAGGIVPLSRLLSGDGMTNDTFTTRNISPLLRYDMSTLQTTLGWEIKRGVDNQLILISPKVSGQSYKQYVQDRSTMGWGIFRDLPMQTCEVFDGTLYLGGADGVVYQYTGDHDAVDLAATVQNPIDWSLLSTYQQTGQGTLAQVAFVNAYYISSGNVEYLSRVLYDFNLSELSEGVPPVTEVGDLWGSALWGSALWGGSAASLYGTQGAAGMGKHFAVALKGSSDSATTLVALHATVQSGGFM